MDIDYSNTSKLESRLSVEADSFGDLLDQFRFEIPAALIGDSQWKHLVAATSSLPATLGAHLFGFEIHLHDPRPVADLGVTVFGGTQTGGTFLSAGESLNASPTAKGISRLLAATENRESSLRRVVGRRTVLEYDISAAESDDCPDPGVFLYPLKAPISDHARIDDFNLLLDWIQKTADRQPDHSVRRVAERIWLAAKPIEGAGAGGFGVFPARGGDKIRLSVFGFRSADEVFSCLEKFEEIKVGKPTLAAAMKFFKPWEDTAVMVLHFDIGPSGVGPKLGLSFHPLLDDPYCRNFNCVAFGRELSNAGLAISKKVEALAGSWNRASTQFGKTGPFTLLKLYLHFKLVLNGDRIEQTKAYVSCILGNRLLTSNYSDAGDE